MAFASAGLPPPALNAAAAEGAARGRDGAQAANDGQTIGSKNTVFFFFAPFRLVLRARMSQQQQHLVVGVASESLIELDRGYRGFSKIRFFFQRERQGGCGPELCVRLLSTQGVWQSAGCVSCEPVCVCVSLVRAVIICPASTRTALVSSPPVTRSPSVLSCDCVYEHRVKNEKEKSLNIGRPTAGR